jgi:dipeptidase D
MPDLPSNRPHQLLKQPLQKGRGVRRSSRSPRPPLAGTGASCQIEHQQESVFAPARRARRVWLAAVVSSYVRQAVDGRSSTDDAYIGFEPREVWRHFSALNNIPRPSGGEEGVRSYIRSLADASSATWAVDDFGNMVVRVAAAGVRGGAAAVAVQSHLDMVCEGKPGVRYDPASDPIRPRRVGDLIYAEGTTLGADDGIGVALSLALLTAPEVRHGPLELLFTVDEERGLRGAGNLDPGLLHARMLINLDGEDARQLIVGSAGAQDSVVRLALRYESLPAGEWRAQRLTVSGLRGGHSGLDIGERRANAIKLIARSVRAMRSAGVPLSLVSVRGGSARNAIPRHAEVDVALTAEQEEPFAQIARRLAAQLREELAEDESALAVGVQSLPTPDAILVPESADALLELLAEIPHGVLAMDAESGGVKTSCNLAHITIDEGTAVVLVSSRSLVDRDMDSVQETLARIAAKLGGEAELASRYAAWTPRRSDGVLLPIAAERYREVHGREPKVQSVHAGLECGTIVAKLPEIEAISFGPSIGGAHTPDEHLSISTVPPTWRLLMGILESLANQRRPARAL